ncbi:hypothetical protein OIU77_001420, partial [Salix suchowensis]
MNPTLFHATHNRQTSHYHLSLYLYKPPLCYSLALTQLKRPTHSPPFLTMNSSSSSSSSHTHYSTSSSDTDTPPSCSAAVRRALRLIQSEDLSLKIEAAKEIRRLTKTSQRCRRQLADAVKPLVCMLRGGDDDTAELNESALSALLNLAVKDE